MDRNCVYNVANPVRDLHKITIRHAKMMRSNLVSVEGPVVNLIRVQSWSLLRL